MSLAPRMRLGLAILFAASLAFVLRDLIERLVLIPFAYIWWGLGLLYRSVPQAVIWTALAVATFFGLVDALLPTRLGRANRIIPAGPVPGPIRALADSLVRHRGQYHRWLMANRLGTIAQRILLQRHGGRVASGSAALHAGDWNPPEAVAAFFYAGLNGSFADYPRPRWRWQQPVANPLDTPPEQALEFLEAQFKELD